jgi:sec-independent protein translocase protein TatA
MPFKIRGPELLILLVIILVLFGVGRIPKIASELGQGLRQFREGLSGAAAEKPAQEPDKQ